MDELAKLMDELSTSLAALNELQSTFALPEDSYTVTDEDDIVAVSATRSGRITAVTVKPKWQQVFEPEELPTRINSALMLSTFRAMGMELPEGREGATPVVEMDFSEVYKEPDVEVTAEDRAQAARLADRSYEDLMARIDSPSYNQEEATERLFANMDELNAVLAADDDSPAPSQDEDQRYFSANGAVSAAATDLGINDVQFREGWADGKSGNVITTCLAEVLEQIPQETNGEYADAMRDVQDLTR